MCSNIIIVCMKSITSFSSSYSQRPSSPVSDHAGMLIGVAGGSNISQWLSCKELQIRYATRKRPRDIQREGLEAKGYVHCKAKVPNPADPLRWVRHYLMIDDEKAVRPMAEKEQTDERHAA